jgi:hypothetical protein
MNRLKEMWNFGACSSYPLEQASAPMSYSPLLLVHICGGILGLLSGAAAMSFRKGSRLHGAAGTVFFISMLCMSSIGAYMALMKSQTNNVLGGVLTFYLVATAWATARRRGAGTGIFDRIAFLFILTVGADTMTYGVEAASSPTGSKDGLPAGIYFFLGSVALLSAAGDIRMIVRGGVSGAQRIARHLWRMSFALFVASASIFLSRPQLFPAILRRTHVLLLLGILPLILMIFWLLRVRFSNTYKRQTMTLRGEVYSVGT